MTLLRIIGGNVQGLQLDESGGKLQDLSQALIDTHAEIACWCETNVDTNKYHVSERSNDTITRFFPHITVTSTSSFISDNIWKPGGTAITTRGRALGRVKSRFSDELGGGRHKYTKVDNGTLRWLVHINHVCRETKMGTSLSIINKNNNYDTWDDMTRIRGKI